MVLHPKLPKVIVEKWETLNSNNFKFYNTTNLIPLFQDSDVLFADTTSAIQEFLIQKKPVVTFNHTFNHNYLLHVNQASNLEDMFNYALSYPKDLIKKIDLLVQELHPYFDGKSSKRIVDTTISYLHKDKSHLKTKPLNLIRKYKIRKKLNYFTFTGYNKPFTISKT